MVVSGTRREIVYGTIVFETIVYMSHILYTTLAYQIKNGRTSGFLDAEICARDVRFITPWNCLRSYLESKLKLTVVSLIQITRNHFREKDTSFFTEIRNAFQSATKLPPDFVFRILSMHEKRLIFANGGLPLRWKFIPSLFASCYFYWSQEWQYQQVMYATTA